MMALADIRDFIGSFGLTEDVYCGKLENKKKESIGVYHRKQSGEPIMAIGGYENTTYGIQPVSLLLHWNKSPKQTEKKAFEVFEWLKEQEGTSIGGQDVSYIRLMVPEPQDIGTDENGICEYVIWFDIIYNLRKEVPENGSKQGISGI